MTNGIPVNDWDYEEFIQYSRGKEKKIKNIYTAPPDWLSEDLSKSLQYIRGLD